MLENIKPIKFYILGASGFLGEGMANYLKKRGHQVFTSRIDVTDFPTLIATFKKVRPEVVINLSGAKAYPTIDWCEDNKAETVKINVGGVLNVTLAALETGVYPIQISTGCLYTGSKETAFTEEDEPNFFGSFYSQMRIVMQKALEKLPVLQVRIRLPIATFSHPRNLINKIVSYPKVISMPNSVTLVEDLWAALEKLAFLQPHGILNITNSGYIDHQQILESYKKIVNPHHTYTIISLEELEGEGGITKAKRTNCVLSNAKATSLGLHLPAIDNERLEEIMISFKKSLI
ncbi:MAG: sugar nucleotide-binding protein [Patescibacteria group bacterium]